jgi:LPXTG-site transpeptidase (sortase) family protein
MLINFIKHKTLKAVIVLLEILAVCLVIYLVVLPFYPALKYKFYSANAKNSKIDYKNISEVKEATEKIIKESAAANNKPEQKNLLAKAGEKLLEIGSKIVPPKKENIASQDKKISSAPNEKSGAKKTAAKSPKPALDRLIIPRIGVNIPIIESANEEYGLDRGTWRVPDSSTPDKGGNTVLTGHRFKYLPPSNLTFYLFHKLEKGDIASVSWKGTTYYYRVKEAKIVPAKDISILDKTDKPILTMFTCDPIYSIKNRLAIISELIYENKN